ncbi:hypothetical protein BAUCODRAFT_304131 [Baudoinia panamericana UAMH 10762]|uniref:Uncharacterized protein n=1 Tax=Baudoinia panamericana (strain UAMH 10762) TaxID=717646 RepID=M2MZJ4_BAUPA|nr:uncharacterized protein BAUCODRAFT_304131 [Baudoinia panamericana UAMH 10762]EMC91765.1 hypothetical protein BAUCODRAFT_304131 [Baudoinia panamericana UAMH 10762]
MCMRDRAPLTQPNIECVLSGAVDVEATGVRDRIYALLALSNAPIATNLSPKASGTQPHVAVLIDYSRSASQVFQDVTKYIMNRNRNLELLIFHVATPSDRNDLRLSSWTPDWRHFSYHLESRALRTLVRVSSGGQELKEDHLKWQSVRPTMCWD